ncbi:MAG TPA: FecR domain-containing protein [Polyangiaceae bacterium]
MIDFAELAARALRGRPVVARPDPNRDDAVAAVAGALARRSRRTTRRFWLLPGAGALAAAAGVALAVSSLGWSSGPSDACSTGVVCATLVVSNGQTSVFEPGEHVAIEHGAGTVSFDNGTRIALDAGSYFEYREGRQTRRFGLRHGAAHVHVVKLSPGERFIVETRDAEVEVKGTVFDVIAEENAECGELTRVVVHEGVVEVRAHGRTERVPSGSRWPRACDEHSRTAAVEFSTATSATSATPSPRPAARLAASPREGSATTLAQPATGAEPTPPAVPAEPAAARPTPEESDLAEQNRIFGLAMQARRAGKLASALSSYEEFLERYPNGPLSESARVERIRILAKLEPGRARALAVRYLADYPRGFAREEVRAIAGP